MRPTRYVTLIILIAIGVMLHPDMRKVVANTLSIMTPNTCQPAVVDVSDPEGVKNTYSDGRSEILLTQAMSLLCIEQPRIEACHFCYVIYLDIQLEPDVFQPFGSPYPQDYDLVVPCGQIDNSGINHDTGPILTANTVYRITTSLRTGGCDQTAFENISTIEF